MHDKLIGYLLNALEVDETNHIEQLLETCEESRCQLEILQQSLAPLQADGGHVNAPRGLAVRTCQRIRQVRSNP